MPKPKTTYERVNEMLSYNSETGVFVWKVDRSGATKAGTEAGSIRSDGYRSIFIADRRYPASHIAWILTYGEWPNGILDHISRDRADDRIANLRLADKSQNAANCHKYRNNSTGFKGVHRVGNRYRAVVLKDRNRHYLGSYSTPEEAHEAYMAAAKELHGEFAFNGVR